MKVGCYSLDLYCDNRSAWPDPRHEYDEFPHNFAGRTEAACIRNAKAMGWRIGQKRQLCPKCAKKKAAP